MGFVVVSMMGVWLFIIPASHPPWSANKGDANEMRVSNIFSTKNTGTIYSTNVKYDMYFIIPEIIHYNDQMSETKRIAT